MIIANGTIVRHSAVRRGVASHFLLRVRKNGADDQRTTLFRIMVVRRNAFAHGSLSGLHNWRLGVISTVVTRRRLNFQAELRGRRSATIHRHICVTTRSVRRLSQALRCSAFQRVSRGAILDRRDIRNGSAVLAN